MCSRSTTLAERLLEATRDAASAAGGGFGDSGSGGDDSAGAAAAEVAAFLIERVSENENASSSSRSLSCLLDDISSFLSAGGEDASILDAGVFDWAPKVLSVGGNVFDGDGDGDDQHRQPSSSSSSSLHLAVRRLATTLATHLSPREALALFSAEITSSSSYHGGEDEERYVFQSFFFR